ncbi:MAG: hypothetical protein J07HB67_02544 [halophilic archaeon J07HB67]|jgi:hypothetical protein|nr:MAG: hypothetical protein J07HB67_02544 [halophilic archaeon J07HB67]
MSWERAETSTAVTEWERTDRMATVRIRERPDGRFVVRVDRLEQAPEGPAYRRETAADRETAETIATGMREEFGEAQ